MARNTGRGSRVVAQSTDSRIWPHAKQRGLWFIGRKRRLISSLTCALHGRCGKMELLTSENHNPGCKRKRKSRWYFLVVSDKPL